MNEKFTRNFMLENIKDFHNLYIEKPIKDNTGGMKSAHIFPVWLLLKSIQPEFIIESGVYQGAGTWFLEDASPSSKIISIDPKPQQRKYTSNAVTYLTDDFLDINWDFIDTTNTLLFLDDHQNSIQRIKYAHSIGIKKVIVEDNYPSNRGDCYSPKKVLSQKPYVIEKNGKKTWYEPNQQDYNFIIENTNIYQEFPPLFKDKLTRWGDEWSGDVYETHDQLLLNNQAILYPDFYLERRDYTWLCYLELT